jgi:hypothetical protein
MIEISSEIALMTAIHWTKRDTQDGIEMIAAPFKPQRRPRKIDGA